VNRPDPLGIEHPYPLPCTVLIPGTIDDLAILHEHCAMLDGMLAP
jgi:hypothetical protein